MSANPDCTRSPVTREDPKPPPLTPRQPPRLPPRRGRNLRALAIPPVLWRMDIPEVEVSVIRTDVEARYVVPGVGFSWDGDV